METEFFEIVAGVVQGDTLTLIPVYHLSRLHA